MKYMIWLLTLLTLSACIPTVLRAPAVNAERQENYVNTHSRPLPFVNAIRAGLVIPGMTYDDVIASMGEPWSVSRTVSETITIETWSYYTARVAGGSKIESISRMDVAFMGDPLIPNVYVTFWNGIVKSVTSL